MKKAAKPKKTAKAATNGNRNTLVSLLLDETGSMQSIKDKTISGFNEYVESLARSEAKEITRLTLVTFNSAKYSQRFTDTPIAKVPKLTHENYQPAAVTPLLDAVGKTITKIEHALKAAKDSPAVLFVVMTDGEENASKEYTHPQIAERIAKKEKEGWTFVYLGANQDAWAVGQTMNMASNSLGYDPGAIGQTFSNLSRGTVAYSRSRASGQMVNSSKTFWKDADEEEEKKGTKNPA